MPRHLQRKRLVAATFVAGALLLVGPAAYGVAVATTTVDNPIGSTAKGVLGSGNDDDGSGNQDSGNGTSSDDNGDGNSDSNSDGNSDNSDGSKNQDSDGQKSGDDNKGGGENKDKGKEQGKDKNALGVLATDCSGSKLAPHDGFQKGNRCVSTEFGEVGTQDENPSLLITSAPKQVSPGQGFQLKVSTRNLVRDRFLAAAKGGYYKETSLLNGQGLQRGHFHTACRILPSSNEAPDAAPKPDFFLATEDGAGGSTPDSVTIDVPGVQQAGELQCSSWAGDGSHRIPMMQRADQTPAFDSVRITVG